MGDRCANNANCRSRNGVGLMTHANIVDEDDIVIAAYSTDQVNSAHPRTFEFGIDFRSKHRES